MLEANQEALPLENSSTRSIERPSSEMNTSEIQNISSNLVNRNHENLSRRLDGLADNLNLIQENVGRR